MKYAVITENDESKWDDKTGVLYHFPTKYINKLTSGTRVIYYKGTMKNKAYEDFRLTRFPHYFGVATIGEVHKDEENPKQYYAQILDFIPFDKPVINKDENNHYYEEVIRENHWRDGVRKISEEVYIKILSQTSHKVEKDVKGSNLVVEEKSLVKLEELNISEVDDVIVHTKKQPISNKEHRSSNPNKNSGVPRYSKNAKIIGDRAEEIVLELLKKEGMKEVVWVAQLSEKPGYDIKFVDIDGVEKYVEVKGTATKRFPNFILTMNELNSSERYRNQYYIYLVAECLSKSPKIQKICDPYSFFENNKWEKTPISYNITFVDDL
ncbi:DUF3883 domain-containing protein [Lysinibacillus sphaericus]|uniref:DUF3883 domain-containing protein n=1 Tax=Lysinibacillus sphaericus TaxID=1421 RepID=UPI0021632859|nr:DUF3883 domain-containing protein [Lysinibacillus sphaericus]MCS1380770.1 DUF3883 domain-containing protein [Lysinibacillus sphaericus]